MEYRHIALTAITTALTSAVLSTTAIANICPTQLQQSSKGYWFSKEKPGWVSHKATPKNVRLEAINFGGAVYSPRRSRMACVYRSKSSNPKWNNKWIALVSKVNSSFLIDKSATDDSGKKPAWKWNKKHGDYACGSPSVTHIKGCTFSFGDEY